MLYEEAKWIGNEILQICNEGSKVLNIGSSSLTLRTILQPHIDNLIFKPLRDNKIEVTHTDIKKEKGVDISGDLTDQNFIKKLKENKYDIVLCSNLLEHIEDRNIIINAIEEILDFNGTAIVTVPFNYPYHMDPIDTMYRPNVSQLTKDFKKLKFLKGEIIEGSSIVHNRHEKNYFIKLINNPKLFLLVITRLMLPFYKYFNWKKTAYGITNIFKKFSVSAVILKKI
ncbi:hypothetical protein N9C59_00375 [Flavobacteriales bacterium]|nr:hypothetical protein [Flavobacteriales bacterium]